MEPEQLPFGILDATAATKNNFTFAKKNEEIVNIGLGSFSWLIFVNNIQMKSLSKITYTK